MLRFINSMHISPDIVNQSVKLISEYIDNALLILEVKGSTFTVRFGNKYFFNTSGYNPETVLNKESKDIITDPKRYEFLESQYKKAIKTREAVEFETETVLKGELIVYANTIIPILEDSTNRKSKVIFLLIVAKNISKYKKIQAQLSMQKEKYKFLADNSSDTIIELDENLKIKYISPSCRNLTGIKDKEFLDKSIKDFIFEEDLKDFENMILNKDKPLKQTLTYRIKKKSKDLVWVESKVKIIGNSKILLDVRDVNDKKKSHDELQQHIENLNAYHKKMFGENIPQEIYKKRLKK